MMSSATCPRPGSSRSAAAARPQIASQLYTVCKMAPRALTFLQRELQAARRTIRYPGDTAYHYGYGLCFHLAIPVDGSLPLMQAAACRTACGQMCGVDV
jgi:hypothetical protein